MTLHVERLTGDAIRRVVPELARLRIIVFRAWPYLYDGSVDYEQRYLARFAGAEGAVVVAAYDGGELIGAATASPMAGHADAFAEPFRRRGHGIASIFYFGESVLLQPYRGRGLGHAFFDHREAQARAAGAFTHTAFCAVVRPNDHPKKPDGYLPLDGFWRKRGYEKVDGLVATFPWKDVDEDRETDKAMQFWMKALEP